MRANSTSARFKELLTAVGKTCGAKGKALYAPVRAALTGATHGPGLGEVAELLGLERVVARLSNALGS